MMNERIKELYDQCKVYATHPEIAGDTPVEIGFNADKFAELIIKECAAFVDGQEDFEHASGPDNWATGADVLKHFGIE